MSRRQSRRPCLSRRPLAKLFKLKPMGPPAALNLKALLAGAKPKTDRFFSTEAQPRVGKIGERDQARAEAAPGPEAKPLPVPALSGEIILPVAATALDQVLLLNQKHAVIGNYRGRCAVLSWERWSIDQEVMTPTFQTFGDFRNRYMNRYVEKETEDGVKKVPAGKYWLGSPRRLSYEAVSFSPASRRFCAATGLTSIAALL